MTMIDLTGQRFGRLVVIERAERPSHCKERSCWWMCKCDCGKTITTSGMYLKSGGKQSCGCKRADISAEKLNRVNEEARKQMALRHEVSCNEMMHMREEGLSNRTIAERLDCSMSTVYKMIGKQPDGIRAPRRSKGKREAEKPYPHEIEKLHISFAERLESMRQPVAEPVAENRKADENGGVLEELRLIFGADAVKAYLSCRLYELRAHPSAAMAEEDCIKALRDMACAV